MIDVPPSAPFPPALAPLDPEPGGTARAGRELLIPLLRADAALSAYERASRQSVILRLSRGVTSHFSKRVGEWFATLLLLQFGLILYGPEPVFPHSPNLAVMAAWASEETWGALCLAIGGVHLGALTINGTFPRFAYSPHVRAAASFLACFLWFQITLAIFMSGVGGTGFGTYRLVLGLELWNVIHAAMEAGRSEGRRKHGR